MSMPRRESHAYALRGLYANAAGVRNNYSCTPRVVLSSIARQSRPVIVARRKKRRDAPIYDHRAQKRPVRCTAVRIYVNCPSYLVMIVRMGKTRITVLFTNLAPPRVS